MNSTRYLGRNDTDLWQISPRALLLLGFQVVFQKLETGLALVLVFALILGIAIQCRDTDAEFGQYIPKNREMKKK